MDRPFGREAASSTNKRARVDRAAAAAGGRGSTLGSSGLAGRPAAPSPAGSMASRTARQGRGVHNCRPTALLSASAAPGMPDHTPPRPPSDPALARAQPPPVSLNAVSAVGHAPIGRGPQRANASPGPPAAGTFDSERYHAQYADRVALARVRRFPAPRPACDLQAPSWDPAQWGVHRRLTLSSERSKCRHEPSRLARRLPGAFPSHPVVSARPTAVEMGQGATGCGDASVLLPADGS